jgi:hypothetical protein
MKLGGLILGRISYLKSLDPEGQNWSAVGKDQIPASFIPKPGDQVSGPDANMFYYKAEMIHEKR